MVLAERFRLERERLALTQPRVAELTGVGKTTVINWEKGLSAPTAVQLSALAEAGLDVLYVVTGQRSAGNAAHDAAEQVLLDSYRRCNAQARQHLIQTAALLAAGVPAGVQGGAGMHMSNLGDGNVQVGGSVGGSVRVRRGK